MGKHNTIANRVIEKSQRVVNLFVNGLYNCAVTARPRVFGLAIAQLLRMRQEVTAAKLAELFHD